MNSNNNFATFNSEQLHTPQGSSHTNYLPMNTTSPFLQYNNNLPKMSNYNKAFESNKPMIDKIDYTNKNNLIHNNVGDNILDEHIVEYRLNIDSSDRDIRYYPDPFSFIVKFNPISSSTITHEEPYLTKKDKIKKTKTVQTRFEGAPMPHINKEFKNIKYIKLENVILPQFSNICIKKKEGEHRHHNDNVKYEFDINSQLTIDRYVGLGIKELDTERVYSTSDGVTRIDYDGNTFTPQIPFAMILPDKLLGTNFYSGVCHYGNKIYKNSMLGNISQLSIQFYDSQGIPLKYDNLFTFDDLQQYEFNTGNELPINDLRHPLNKRLQTCFSLIVGVVESQINTNTKFEY